MALVDIFLAFFRIGLFAIGGAYSFLPLIEKEVVERYQWLSKQEFLDVLGIVKIFPGAISIKFATYTGYKIAGFPGAVVANIANLLSPALLIFIATYFYQQHKDLPAVKNAFATIQLVVFAMIIAVAFQMIDVGRLVNFKSLLVILAAFVLFLYTKLHPALIIIGAGFLGMLVFK
ncbi:MAG: chromate transporter [Candidatus Omnitrophota bacterium]